MDGVININLDVEREIGRDYLMKNRTILVLLLIAVGCVGTAQSQDAYSQPRRVSLTIQKNYDDVWKAAMTVLTEAQTCEGCFFSITSSDRSSGIISASSNREDQMSGQINVRVSKVSDNETAIIVNGSLAQHKYWSNLYGAKYLERWEDVDSDFAAKIADQISLVASGSYGKSDADTFLKVSADKSNISTGSYVTLDYVLYIRYNTTYQGFSRHLKIGNQFINVLMKRPESEGGGYYEEGPYFGISASWDDLKKMLKIVVIGEDAASSNVLLPNDYVKSINNEGVKNIAHFMELLRKQRLDKETKFSIIRDGKEMDVEVVPRNSFYESSRLNRAEIVKFTFDTNFNKKDGNVNVASTSEPSDLMKGDIIKEVDSLPIHSLDDWRKVTNELQESKIYHFLVIRNGEEKHFDIKPLKEKIYISAEYFPPPTNNVKKQEITLDGKKYTIANIQKIRIRFDKPGDFLIDPGSIQVLTSILGMTNTRVLEYEPIKVSVSS